MTCPKLGYNVTSDSSWACGDTAFFGGACGSTLATATYHWGGWTATAGAAATLGTVAFAYFLTEFSGKSTRA